jgi:hypothetical protein
MVVAVISVKQFQGTALTSKTNYSIPEKAKQVNRN